VTSDPGNYIELLKSALPCSSPSDLLLRVPYAIELPDTYESRRRSFGSSPSDDLSDSMAFSNTIKYYITGNGITTPSSSSESGSATGESASIKAPSRRAVGDHSHKPCEAYSQGTKRTGESCVHD
jgi:hypothetical protein